MKEEINIETKTEPNMGEMVKKLYEKAVVTDETQKQKKFKLPWSAKVNNGRASKGYTTVQIIRNNGDMQLTRLQIDDGTMVDGVPRISTIDYKLNYKGKPWVIIPEWSLKPFSSSENYEQTIKDKMNIAGRKVILSKLEKETIKPKGKGFGGFGGWMILIVVVAIGGYMLLKGGKLF